MTAPSIPASEVARLTASQVLVERYQAGDPNAFADIYRLYYPAVLRFACGRLSGGSSRQLAEDITADTFEKALRRLSTFEWRGTDLAAWLVTIARNLIADHWKSYGTRFTFAAQFSDRPDVDRLLRERAGDLDDPEDTFEAYEIGRAVWSAAQRLSKTQRECIVLRFLQGLSVAETAQEMGINVGAAKALQYRAVRALRRELELDGWDASAVLGHDAGQAAA